MRYAIIPMLLAGPALAHTGETLHVHPHDGASWLAVVAALALIGGAAVLARATVRRRK